MKKNNIYLWGISFSILFSLFYILVFNYYIPSQESEEKTLYLNQIGLFQDENNAQTKLKSLNENEIDGYIYYNQKVYVVVCGVSEDEKQTKINGEKLTSLSNSYIEKKITINDEKIIEAINNKNYQKVLELIGDKS